MVGILTRPRRRAARPRVICASGDKWGYLGITAQTVSE